MQNVPCLQAVISVPCPAAMRTAMCPVRGTQVPKPFQDMAPCGHTVLGAGELGAVCSVSDMDETTKLLTGSFHDVSLRNT